MVDITTLSIVLVILAAFSAPFIYAHQKKKQQENHLISFFMTKAKEYQLHIVSYELWRRAYVIGLDKNLHQLLYIKFQPEMQVKLVDLKQIKKVNIVNEHRIVGPDKQKIVDKLWLLLIPEDPKLADTYLEFYNDDENIDLMGEPLLLQKWQNLIEISRKESVENPSEKKLATGPGSSKA